MGAPAGGCYMSKHIHVSLSRWTIRLMLLGVLCAASSSVWTCSRTNGTFDHSPERDPLVGTFTHDGVTYTIPTPQETGEPFAAWMARHKDRLNRAETVVRRQ